MSNILTKPPGNLSAERVHKVSDGERFWRISTGAEGMHTNLMSQTLEDTRGEVCLLLGKRLQGNEVRVSCVGGRRSTRRLLSQAGKG